MLDILKWCVRLASGAVGFLVVNFAVGMLASPRFPNEYGPVAWWVYALVIVISLAVLAGAVLRPAWRTQTLGFVLAYLVTTLGSNAQFTRTWTHGLSLLDPTAPFRERRHEVVKRDSLRVATARRNQAEFAAWTLSDAGRGELALHALAAGACALGRVPGGATQDAAPATELLPGARSCASYRADADPQFTVSFATRPGAEGSPPIVMTLRPRDEVIRYPEFLVDSTGLATVQLNGRDAPHAVASPMDAAMRIRYCLKQRAGELAQERSAGRLAADGDARLSLREARRVYLCQVLATYEDPRTPSDSDALRLCVDVYGREDCRRTDRLVTYRVRLATSAGALRIDPAPGSPGLRHYYVAADDSVFATSVGEASPAAPLAARCEVNVRVRCGPK